MDTLTIQRSAPLRAVPALLVLAGAMLALFTVTSALAVLRPQEVLGVNAWFKPMKFTVSIAVYSATLAWLVGQVTGRRRRVLAEVAGWVFVVTMIIEMAIIWWAAATGTTSHFNMSTPLNAALWTTMGASIQVAWIASLLVAVVVWRNLSEVHDPAAALAIRAGVVVSLIGLALGLLMIVPTAQQLAHPTGIIGAHTVGVADGGPGLPFFGWSTTGGDLRIPHFVGMHAVQVLPLLAWTLQLLGRRVPTLRSAAVRTRLVAVATAAYVAALVVITLQALAGQSIAHPSGGILVAGWAVAIACAAGAVGVLAVAYRGGEPPSRGTWRAAPATSEVGAR